MNKKEIIEIHKERHWAWAEVSRLKQRITAYTHFPNKKNILEEIDITIKELKPFNIDLLIKYKDKYPISFLPEIEIGGKK